jgi:transposase
MKTRRIVLHPRTREKLRRVARRCRDADTRVRYLIVLRAADGWSGKRVARALGCRASTVSRTLDRWEAYGEAGLLDRREDNGQVKADELYVATVRWILAGTPRDFLHRRPTWTRALLVETARLYTGVTVSRTTMGRVLAGLKARRGRAKPLGPCPWSKARKERRMALIRALVGSLPPDQACVWEDEAADIDLNPRIGADWTLPGGQRTVPGGQRTVPGGQRTVPTPGKNVKRYFAAAMDAMTGRLVWVKGHKKNSRLFIELLKKLLKEYPDRKVVHVILDNYCVHSSRQTRAWLGEHGEKLRLHFLPPYSPDDNRIERKLWREVHANVTTNHRCTTIEWLCDEVVWYLMSHNRRARELCVRQSRPAI